MSSRSSRIVVPVALVALLAACSSSTGTGTPCHSSLDCQVGQICSGGECLSTQQSGASNTSGASSGGTSSNSSGNTSGTSTGSGSNTGATSGSSSGSSSNTGATSGSSGATSTASTSVAASSTSSSSSSAGGTPVTCSAPSTTYKNNGSGCGTERWPVKTANDQDVNSVNPVPQVSTIAQLIALPIPANQSATCNRNAPTEDTIFTIQDVNIHFQALESDSDYHLVIKDSSGNTMIAEVPAPKCLGLDTCSTNNPYFCEITHARANADAIDASRTDTIGTVSGIGFFDFLHGQTGVAPNGIELHPVLGICFGQGCDPYAGY